MYTILLLLLGLTTFMSGLVSAQNNVLGIPDCAVPCFTEAIGNSTCGITDAYCQCTSGAAKIQSVAISCLCHSSCSTADLIGAYIISFFHYTSGKGNAWLTRLFV